MTYQDQKIKAIYRGLFVAVWLTALLLVSLIYPDPTRSLVQKLPLSRHGSEYGIWLGVLSVMTPLVWAVNVGLILTSPEQEVRFSAWSKRWNKTPSKFDELEFDTLDPDYRKAAWRYFMDRRKR